ncbi:MAG: glycosyltransferase family 2 protein [Methanobacterium sp.]|uniref:glycosyltransferase family 2 protein n=1 Tax=Methanobacterium sp. TaxID=2164 RepID=UPI003C70D532
MVKNEMDIIESFIRYNLNIVDGMIILDNNSSDNTLTIIKNLMDEGLSVFYIEDEDSEYGQDKKMTNLLNIAVDKFDADIIIPLDVDEFITSKDRGNPRKLLEKLDSQSYYLVKWKTYIPYFDKKIHSKFIPSQITFARDEEFEKYYKVIIPSELVKNYSVKLSVGNHEIIYEEKYKNIIKSEYKPDLCLAHFPLRSREQTLSKIVIGWISSLHRENRVKGESFHWENIFNTLKEIEEISNEDVTNLATEYALKGDVGPVNIKLDPMDLTFCNNINIIYTPDKINPISNLLYGFELFSNSHLNFKKESIKNEQRLNTEITSVLLELKDFIEQEKLLKSKIYKYENSLSWKITSPLRKVSKMIRNRNN